MRDPVQRTNGAAEDPLEAWPAFEKAVRARLERGRATYRDQSFERDPAALLSEVAEELLDVCGWSYVLWRRMQELAAKVAGKLDVHEE